MAPRPVCRYYLKGKCNKGETCKFRHSVPGFITAKEIAAKEEPTGTYTALVNGNIKATLADGAKPTHIDFVLMSSPVLEVKHVDTSLEVTWFQPTRNVWLYLHDKDQAEAAAKALEGVKIKESP